MSSTLKRKSNHSNIYAVQKGCSPLFFIVVVVFFVAIIPFFLEPGDHASTSSYQDNVRSSFSVKRNSNSASIQTGKTSVGSSGLPKTLVIYFPQYHQDPVNDRNWGENFTDWDSLRQSPSENRMGQVIPRPFIETLNNSSNNLPPPLGYYDLTDKTPRKTQGTLAKKYGVDGFIYHHYWFYDRSDPGPTLAKPLERMLEDGHPDIPFLLNWCAVRWVNVWMGKAIFQKIPTNKNRAIVLQEQYFDPTDDMIYQHYQWLKPFFHHPNYIRVDGQPAFLLYSYNPLSLPILETLRKFAKEDGFPGLHFIVGRSSHHEDLYDTSHIMNKIEFEFQLKQLQTRDSVDPTQRGVQARSIYSLEDDPYNASSKEVAVNKIWDYNPFNQTMTYPYPLWIVNKPYEVPNWCMKPPGQTTKQGEHSTASIPIPPQGHPEIIGVITAFDNTPRRKYDEAHIWNGGNTQKGESPVETLERFSKSYQAALYYQKCCVIGSNNAHVGSVKSPVSPRLMALGNGDGGDRFVAINSWNEWGEGMAIEPSNVYGYRWLETIKAVQETVKSQSCPFG